MARVLDEVEAPPSMFKGQIDMKKLQRWFFSASTASASRSSNSPIGMPQPGRHAL